MYAFQLPGTSISEDLSVKQLVVSLDSLHDIAALFFFNFIDVRPVPCI